MPRWTLKAADHWSKSVWSNVDGRYDDETRLIREQVRCWILKLILHTGKTNFKPIFIVFIDHKITCRRVEEIHILNMALTPWVPEVFAIFRKKSFLPSLLPCPSNSSHRSFIISFTLVLAWFLISAFSLRYCEIQWERYLHLALHRLNKPN